jgi:predicted Zn finger-like uncharacterized protein
MTDDEDTKEAARIAKKFACPKCKASGKVNWEVRAPANTKLKCSNCGGSIPRTVGALRDELRAFGMRQVRKILHPKPPKKK